jgi:anti-anti-sigma factor
VLCVSGELDFTTAPALLAASHPARCRLPLMSCDLSGVTFIDAAGIGALVIISNDMRHHGLALRLSEPSPRVVRVFTIVGLQGMLDCSPLPEAA